MQPTNDSQDIAARGRPRPHPVALRRRERATPFGAVTPTVPHWPGAAAPPESRAAASAATSEREDG